MTIKFVRQGSTATTPPTPPLAIPTHGGSPQRCVASRTPARPVPHAQPPRGGGLGAAGAPRNLVEAPAARPRVVGDSPRTLANPSFVFQGGVRT